MRKGGSIKSFILIILGALAMCIALVWIVFTCISSDYHDSVANESADHLIETNAQIKLFLEELFANDHEIATSLANSISLYQQDDLDTLMSNIRRERDIWGLSDVYVYAENGFCIGTDGDIKRSDAAADIIYYARANGEYMSIVQSTITYSLPVRNALTINGSPMAAVSIVRNIDSLVDDMGFSSFGDEAYIYLAQDNGAIISKLTHPKATNVYNILALLEKYGVLCLSHGTHSMDARLPTGEPCAFLYTDEDGETMYMVATPIRNGSEVMRLLYFVPEDVVNSTMLGFSSTITHMSFAMIGAFAFCAALIFALLYRERKLSFDSAIVARDRMLDQLVSNTRNAFAYLAVDQREPLYISSNAEAVMGDKYMWLERTPRGLRMAFPSSADTEAAQVINRTLEAWDGASDFVSGFAPYTAGGIDRYFVMRLYPVGEGGGEFVAIAQDVTLEREREEALKSALKRADSASLAKTRFLANMSHDIRTPMNAIINMTDFAMETPDDKRKLMGYLRVIRESSEHLLRLINDILDMSRIESGQVASASEPFDMRACMDELCAMIEPLCKGKGQSFDASYGDIESTSLVGDKLKLTRVLVNLLNNAVKFTGERGRVGFVVEELPSLRANFAAFRFSVTDNGSGIPKEYIESIFEPFTRVESDSAKAAEGSGLGLSICKSYVVALGGTIVCQSELGEGSTFVVELFFQRSSAAVTRHPPPAEREARAMFTGKRALVVEDNPINQTIARKILVKYGFIVDVAEDGREAVAMYRSSASGYFDIIFMDIQMPLMNGYEATRLIRESDRPDARTIPVIAMTANVFAEDVETARAAGMNGHLGKPLSVDELLELSGRLIPNKEG